MWLESVWIAIHDYMVIHDQYPYQQTITNFFHCNDNSSTDTHTQQAHTQVRDNAEDDTELIPALI